MKTWAVYENAEHKVQIVERGLNAHAFLFTGFWALAKGLYIQAIAMLAAVLIVSSIDAAADTVYVMDGGFMVGGFSFATSLIAGIVFCIFGNKWVEKELLNKGYVFKGTCKTKTKEAAKQFFISWCEHRIVQKKA